MFRSMISLVCLALVSPPGSRPATRATTRAAASRPAPAEVAAISRQLQDHDGAVRDQAVAAIRKRIDEHPGTIAEALAYNWLKPLMKGRYYNEVVEWSLVSTLSRRDPPLDMPVVEDLHSARARALLALGRNEEALAESKSLYNVIRMKETALAITLVAKCLAADPKTAPLVEKFMAEQEAGAVAGITQPARGAAGGPSVLKGIKVDPAPYLPWIEKEKGRKDLHSLMRLGNRLLLADKPGEAMIAFKAAYQIADDQQLPWVTESIARTMRAEDGTIGRANAWLAAQRQSQQTSKPAGSQR